MQLDLLRFILYYVCFVSCSSPTLAILANCSMQVRNLDPSTQLSIASEPTNTPYLLSWSWGVAMHSGCRDYMAAVQQRRGAKTLPLLDVSWHGRYAVYIGLSNPISYRDHDLNHLGLHLQTYRPSKKKKPQKAVVPPQDEELDFTSGDGTTFSDLNFIIGSYSLQRPSSATHHDTQRPVTALVCSLSWHSLSHSGQVYIKKLLCLHVNSYQSSFVFYNKVIHALKSKCSVFCVFVQTIWFVWC